MRRRNEEEEEEEEEEEGIDPNERWVNMIYGSQSPSLSSPFFSHSSPSSIWIQYWSKITIQLRCVYSILLLIWSLLLPAANATRAISRVFSCDVQLDAEGEKERIRRREIVPRPI